MTVILAHRSGKMEIASFKYDEGYPQRIRVRSVVGADHEEQIFHRRWTPRGRPIYVEEEPDSPPSAA